jgi:hypothetical protein
LDTVECPVGDFRWALLLFLVVIQLQVPKWYYTLTTQAQLAKPVRAFFGYTNFPAAYASNQMVIRNVAATVNTVVFMSSSF